MWEDRPSGLHVSWGFKCIMLQVSKYILSYLIIIIIIIIIVIIITLSNSSQVWVMGRLLPPRWSQHTTAPSFVSFWQCQNINITMHASSQSKKPKAKKWKQTKRKWKLNIPIFHLLLLSSSHPQKLLPNSPPIYLVSHLIITNIKASLSPYIHCKHYHNYKCEAKTKKTSPSLVVQVSNR